MLGIIIFSHLAFGLLISQLLRLIFFIYYFEYLSELSKSQIIESFFYGLRFDLAAWSIYFSIFYLILLFPQKKSAIFNFTVSIVAWIFLELYLAIFFVDLFYFSSVNRHISFEIGILNNDFYSVIKLILISYFWQTVAALLTIIATSLIWFYIWQAKIKPRLSKIKQKTPIIILNFLLVILLLTIFIRGGFQVKPLSVSDSLVSNSEKQAALILNAPFILVKQIGAENSFKEITWLGRDEAYKNSTELLITDENQMFTDKNFPLYRIRQGKNPQLKNIVIIIVESFSSYLLSETAPNGKSLLPFLNALTADSLYFNHFVANGSRSIEGLASTLACLPSYYNSSFIFSDFQQDKIFKAPQELKKQGYFSLFLHGSFYGSFNLHQFAKSLGFEQVFAKEDIEGYSNHSDNVWGVYDSYSLPYFLNLINQSPKPIYASIFTLSTHEPFNSEVPTPVKYPDDSLKSKYKESFSLLDKNLKDFFTLAKSKNWFKDTVFVITGDHSWGGDSLKSNTLIPLIIYNSGLPPKVYDNWGSQSDILPSLFDLLDLTIAHSCAGKSLFRGSTPFALSNRQDSIFYYKNEVYLMNGRKFINSYDKNFNPVNVNNEAAIKYYQSWIETNNNLLVNNKIIP